MAFEVSEFIDPIQTTGGIRSEFTQKLNDVPVGKAFIVSGMTHSNASSRAHAFAARTPGRKYSCGKLEDGRIQVTRIS